VNQKEKVRKECKGRIEKISPQKRKEKSEEIALRLTTMEIVKKAESICVYLSKEDEVQTIPFIKNLLGQKMILVPTIKNDELTFCVLEDLDELVIGRHGILEPKHFKTTKQECSIFIVPGLGFDKEGNRLGRGKGYYDKALSKTTSKKIGLAFEEQITTIPVEAHDIRMDCIITDKKNLQRFL
jgi:5-formyltetrahydrofolate cyclo-ligase